MCIGWKRKISVSSVASVLPEGEQGHLLEHTVRVNSGWDTHRSGQLWEKPLCHGVIDLTEPLSAKLCACCRRHVHKL